MANTLVGWCAVGSDSSLVDRNPFVWDGFSPELEISSQQNRPTRQVFEFHAVYELSGQTRVLIMERDNKRFHWLEVGKELEGFLAKSFDPDSNQLVFSYENDEQYLELMDQQEVTSAPLSNTVAATRVPTARPPTTPGSNLGFASRRTFGSSRTIPSGSNATATPFIPARIPSGRKTSVQPSEKDLQRFQSFEGNRPESFAAPSLGDLKPPEVELPIEMEW